MRGIVICAVGLTWLIVSCSKVISSSPSDSTNSGTSLASSSSQISEEELSDSLKALQMADSGIITDERDNQEYGWVRIDTLRVIISDLNVQIDSLCNGFALACEDGQMFYPGSYIYFGSNICPEDWRIPSLKEWNALISNINNRQRLHISYRGVINDSTLQMDSGLYSHYWSSEVTDSLGTIMYFRDMVYSQTYPIATHAAPVRCVQGISEF
jgi:hypothetical protein